MREWTRIDPNEILENEEEDFFISYNPGNFILSSFRSDTGGCETALCTNGKYMILNGDFRKDYEKLIDSGLDKCVEFYESKKEEYSSSWSS